MFGVGLGAGHAGAGGGRPERRALRAAGHGHLGGDLLPQIGGSFGTAVFGAIFANLLATNVIHSLHLDSVPAGLRSSLSGADPKSLDRLPPAMHAGVVAGMVHTIQTVFLIGVPVAVVAFVLLWLLPDIELRKTVRNADPGKELGMHEPRSSLEEIQLSWSASACERTGPSSTPRWRPGPGCSSTLDRAWLLYRFADRPDRTLQSVAARLKVDPERIEAGIDSLVTKGLVEMVQGPAECEFSLTDQGRDAIDRLQVARRAGLTELLDGWDPEAHPEIGVMVRQLAHELLADDDKLLADATGSARRKVPA